MEPHSPAFQFPSWIILSWAGMFVVSAAVTIGVLVYISKYLTVEKHFIVILVMDNACCLLLSLAGFVNYMLMVNGFYYLTSCYIQFYINYYTNLIGSTATALISALR